MERGAVYRWYCVWTQPKREALAVRSLRGIPAIEVFCPMIRFQRLTVRGPRWFTEAMFPRYIFAKFSFADSRRRVQSARGVSGIVLFGGEPAEVPASAIDRLRHAAGPEEMVVVAPGRKEGTASGRLSGIEAIVAEFIPGPERIRVLMDLLGESIITEPPRKVAGDRRGASPT